MTSIVVTGATGYIGGHLVRAAAQRGWEVIAASRTRSPDCRDWIAYRLEDPLDAERFPVGAAVVHLAADTSSGADDTVEREVDSARRLLEVARSRELAVVFVSSQAARSDAPTAYGRAKWHVEQLMLESEGTVVRPGLVYGGRRVDSSCMRAIVTAARAVVEQRLDGAWPRAADRLCCVCTARSRGSRRPFR